MNPVSSTSSVSAFGVSALHRFPFLELLPTVVESPEGSPEVSSNPPDPHQTCLKGLLRHQVRGCQMTLNAHLQTAHREWSARRCPPRSCITGFGPRARRIFYSPSVSEPPMGDSALLRAFNVIWQPMRPTAGTILRGRTHERPLPKRL